MSRVITFSRQFPKGHPKQGDPTFFPEKILISLGQAHEYVSEQKLPGILNDFALGLDEPKHHTIRAGTRWKVSDKFSPRVWSGKPYRSKMITIAPDIEVKKVWNVLLYPPASHIFIVMDGVPRPTAILEQVAKNDGLGLDDFKDWFNIKKRTNAFAGQIICWNEKIEY